MQNNQEAELTKILREILKWTKFAGMNQVQSILEKTLDVPQKKLAYQLSDGSLGVVKVAQLSQVGSHDRVAKLWKEWRRKGLGETLSVQGGDWFKRTFDLEDFGIEFPELPKSHKETSTSEKMTVSTIEGQNEKVEDKA